MKYSVRNCDFRHDPRFHPFEVGMNEGKIFQGVVLQKLMLVLPQGLSNQFHTKGGASGDAFFDN